MALTIAPMIRCSLGGKAFRISKVTIGAVTAGVITVTAGSIDLASIEAAFLLPGTVTSLDLGDYRLSTTSGAYIDAVVTSTDAADIFYICAIGT